MNEEVLIKCPHCGFGDEPYSFPDLFFEYEKKAEYREQYKLLKQLQDLGYNVVTCGMCGNVIITSKKGGKL